MYQGVILENDHRIVGYVIGDICCATTEFDAEPTINDALRCSAKYLKYNGGPVWFMRRCTELIQDTAAVERGVTT